MKAILLLAFGGPRSLDEVEPFLTRLFRGRKPSSEQLEKIKDRYRLIGGRFASSRRSPSGQAKGSGEEARVRRATRLNPMWECVMDIL